MALHNVQDQHLKTHEIVKNIKIQEVMLLVIVRRTITIQNIVSNFIIDLG
jgi:uncharacterized membrane protein YwzB